MDFSNLCDELGPEKIIHVYDPKLDLRGILVIDNTARGVGKGGLRVAPDVTVEVLCRLARTMTYKLAMAEIPWGGAKSGIIADPSDPRKVELIRAFARGLRDLIPQTYIFGIDMGMVEEDICPVVEEMASLQAATGKPDYMGGIPPYRLGITGFGVAEAAAVAAEFAGFSLSGAAAVVQGVGWVGKAALQHLASKGVRIIAAADSQGGVYNEQGLDPEGLLAHKARTGTLTRYGRGVALASGEELELGADILVLAAKEDVINAANVGKVQAKVLVEGANLPVPHEYEAVLHARGTLVVPDFVANFGGALAAWTEFCGGTAEDAFRLAKYRVSNNVRLVLERVRATGESPREVAMNIAKERVLKAMVARGRLEKRGGKDAGQPAVG